MFSSMKGDWRTPQDLFNQLDEEFRFTLDVCADRKHPLSAHIRQYFDDEGLKLSWKESTCFMNPPYQRGIIDQWMAKATEEVELYRDGFDKVKVVALIPARTETEWFWNNVTEPHFDNPLHREIRPIKGRVKFSGHKTGAPFPSLIVVFK